MPKGRRVAPYIKPEQIDDTTLEAIFHRVSAETLAAMYKEISADRTHEASRALAASIIGWIERQPSDTLYNAFQRARTTEDEGAYKSDFQVLGECLAEGMRPGGAYKPVGPTINPNPRINPADII